MHLLHVGSLFPTACPVFRCQLERMSGQQYPMLLLPHELLDTKMAFRSNVPDTILPADRSVPSAERSFKSTRWYYEHFHPTGISVPVAKFRHAKPIGFRRGIFQADFCDRCGIDGDDVEMHYCKSCHEHGIDTVTHMECVNKHELLWLEANPVGRHWRCRPCR